MLNIIKESYMLFFKKMHIWFLIALPLAVFSYVDDAYLGSVFSSNVWQIVGVLLLVLSQIVAFHYMMEMKKETVAGFVKKWLLLGIFQIVMGFIMMVPVFVLLRITEHHNLFDYVMGIGIFLNVFLGGWLFAKASAVVPLIVQEEKLSWNRFKEFSKGSYVDWLMVSALIYFPYVLVNYCACNLIVLSLGMALLLMLLCAFNATYYQAKK